MGIARVSSIGLETIQSYIFNGLAPTPINARVGLLGTGLTLGEASTIADIIGGELLTVNGYSRQVLGQAFTVDTTADTVLITDHRRSDTQPCFVLTTTTLPSPLVTGTKYFVKTTGNSNNFQLATAPGGTAIDFTSTGTGTHYLRMGGVYDSGSDHRFENIYNEVRFTAAGGAIVWQGWFLLLDCVGTSNILVTSIVPATDVITTTTTHGLTTGDPVMLTTDSGGTQPGNTSATTLYYARAVSTTTLTMHSTASGAIANTGVIDITGAGSGTIRVRYGKGFLYAFEYLGSAVTVADGQVQRIEIPINLANIGDGVGI